MQLPVRRRESIVLQLRRVVRLLQFALLLCLCSVDYLWRSGLSRRSLDIHARSRWLQRWARSVGRCLRLRSTYSGAVVPRGTLLVSNHVSYLDILVIAAHQPVVFVSKAEVRHWPVLGWITARAGTLYLDRQRKTATGGAALTMRRLLEQGLVVVVFPEGTSSDGRQVLPFRSSLFAAAVEAGASVTPAALSYSLSIRSGDAEAAYWGDMTFGAHLWRLLGCDTIEATCRFGEPIHRASDRKVLALDAQTRVEALLKMSNATTLCVRPAGFVRPMGTTQAYEPDPT